MMDTAGYHCRSHPGPSCECVWLAGFGYMKVTPMSVVARFLLGWTALSAAVSPFVGMLLHRLQLDTVPASLAER